MTKASLPKKKKTTNQGKEIDTQATVIIDKKI